MKNKITALLLFGITVLFFSCGSENKKDSGEVSQQTELPPSLKTEDVGNNLIQLSDKEQSELTIKTVQVTNNFIDYSVVAPGVVFQAPNHASIISTPINGQIHEVYKFEGSWVKRGDVLFEIQSLEFGNLVSEYLQAFAEERFQTNRLTRLKQLVEETITSANELERATAEFDRATASSRAAYSRLKAVGVSDHEINLFTKGENIDPVLKIYSPIDGVVEKNFVELGQSVNALENLSRVLDTREVLIRAYLSPDDARLITVGDSVAVSKREKQENLLNARITSINPGLDESSRSVIANIVVPTSAGWPKPGENVRLSIVTSSQKETIAIPVEALTYDGNQAIVFVQKGNGIYEKRPIEVSEIRDRYVFVNSGLKNGEDVAVSNVFSLKALSRFDIIAEE
ncbi:efflux RND transporter periplasmic adaptor subunit [Maribellus comscasis]|uniref:Efflux RND transporter periplasmic adaptor subunit n=1 Tax=Maribellus comscasis TaxID=2681766 RepID=A0A6I6JPZ0_9BACT|nr:efflux RND transporter periplasmic adaptor subunit [Maribellus comscasis]QGY44521.1 efflux RND transporter periplasmic adaptor subunit [Maribellus comscasis]